MGMAAILVILSGPFEPIEIDQLAKTNIPFPLRSHSIQFSSSSFSVKLDSNCNFCNEVTSSCDHHVTFDQAIWRHTSRARTVTPSTSEST